MPMKVYMFPANKAYRTHMGPIWGYIWAAHMGPIWFLQTGSIWVPYGLYLGSIWALYGAYIGSLSHSCESDGLNMGTNVIPVIKVDTIWFLQTGPV